MNNKPVLAVETSSDLCSVALLTPDGGNFSLNIRQKHIHSEKLISMIQSVLEYSGVSINELSYIAISMGPGSFTGLRIGLSAVKGIATGASIPICPVPTFEAFAYYLIGYMKEGDSFTVARNVNVDELYVSRFCRKGDSYVVLDGLSIIQKTDFNAYIKERDILFGNYSPVKDKLQPADADALAIARWADAFGSGLVTSDFDYLEPDYIKKFEGRKL